MPYGDQATVTRLLEMGTWAVVGLSPDPGRPSYRVARFLQAHGVRVIPVNPHGGGELLGEPVYPALADVPGPIDVVDVFRRSEAAGAIADEAISLVVRGIWFQLGVIDTAAYARAQATGIDMVMDRCPMIEWSAAGAR
jgi:predicted CoA-binding protein